MQDPDRIHNAQEMANDYIGERRLHGCTITSTPHRLFTLVLTVSLPSLRSAFCAPVLLVCPTVDGYNVAISQYEDTADGRVENSKELIGGIQGEGNQIQHNN